jgi:hypothetical protein
MPPWRTRNDVEQPAGWLDERQFKGRKPTLPFLL